jgi:aminoglycoside phosphotransferase (APT) family kinase protein
MEVAMIALATSPPATDISSALLEDFKKRLNVDDLTFAEPPESIPDGWEAQVYRFRLEKNDALPLPFQGPLAARAYSSEVALDRMRREMNVQTFLSDSGFPVPKPLFLEESGDIFGGPFLIMEWVPGPTLIDLLLPHWLSILWVPSRMAEIHARLHQVPLRGFKRPDTPFLDRSLAALERAIWKHRLETLAPGWRWLDEHRPTTSTEECIIHLDFHPINLIFDEDGCRAVLDWSDAEAGDRHADIATTLMLIELAPLDLPGIWDKLALAVGKHILGHEYLRAYRKLLPIDEDRLPYYRAWAALRRLVQWGSWLHAGPRAVGIKTSCLEHLPPRRLSRLCRSFARHTGVAIAMA